MQLKNQLKDEWERTKVCGEEHASYLRENPEKMTEKIKQLNDYREKLIASTLSLEDKEDRLKDTQKSLNYLKPNYDNLLIGILIGGVAIGGVICIWNWVKDYAIEKVVDKLRK